MGTFESIPLKKGTSEGWGDISVSKVFTIQARGPESDLQHLCRKPVSPREVCRLGVHFWDDPLSFPTVSFPVSLVFVCQSSESSFERLGMSYPSELCILLREGELFFGSCPYRVSLQGVPHGYSDLSSGEMVSLVFGATFHLLLFETWV